MSFDPNIRPELLGIEHVREIVGPVLEACDLLLPSEAEATMLTGDADEETACRNLLARGVPICGAQTWRTRFQGLYRRSDD